MNILYGVAATLATAILLSCYLVTLVYNAEMGNTKTVWAMILTLSFTASVCVGVFFWRFV